MLADVGDCGDFAIVFENRHAFAGNTDDAGTVFGNVSREAGSISGLFLAPLRGGGGGLLWLEPPHGCGGGRGRQPGGF